MMSRLLYLSLCRTLVVQSNVRLYVLVLYLTTPCTASIVLTDNIIRTAVILIQVKLVVVGVLSTHRFCSVDVSERYQQMLQRWDGKRIPQQVFGVLFLVEGDLCGGEQKDGWYSQSVSGNGGSVYNRPSETMTRMTEAAIRNKRYQQPLPIRRIEHKCTHLAFHCWRVQLEGKEGKFLLLENLVLLA